MWFCKDNLKRDFATRFATPANLDKLVYVLKGYCGLT